MEKQTIKLRCSKCGVPRAQEPRRCECGSESVLCSWCGEDFPASQCEHTCSAARQRATEREVARRSRIPETLPAPPGLSKEYIEQVEAEGSPPRPRVPEKAQEYRAAIWQIRGMVNEREDGSREVVTAIGHLANLVLALAEKDS